MTHKLRLDFEFPSYLQRLYRFTVRRLAGSFESYQPVHLNGSTLGEGARACLDRWTQIQSVLVSTNSRSLLDLGCAEGYFVQQAASHGYLALGVDADVRRLTIAQSTCLLNRIEHAGFLYGHITSELVESLPDFDLVLFLSVLHHVMYEHGVDFASNLMKAIRKRTRLGLVFDMGQSNEMGHEWARLLPPMTPSPQTWIADFLRQVGFSKIEVLSETDAYMSSERRYLFFCRP